MLERDHFLPDVNRQSDQPVVKRSKGLSAFSKFRGAIEKTKSKIAVVADHKNTKALVEWTTKAGADLMDQAAELGDDVLHSDLGKAATKGAAIGAVAAIPVPLIGPIGGAIVGAGVGSYLSLKHGIGRSSSEDSGDHSVPNGGQPQSTDGLLQDIKRLDELRQSGVLSDVEFQEQKAKLLKRI